MRATLYQALGAISLTASPPCAQAQRLRADAGACYSLSDALAGAAPYLRLFAFAAGGSHLARAPLVEGFRRQLEGAP
jgi:hypothetical protein